MLVVDIRNASGLSTGKSNLHSIQVKDKNESLKITLVWTDPAAELSAGKALVNDLDLVVVSPGGATYRGNFNFLGGFSQPQSEPVAADPNNVEMVIVAAPDPGTWNLRVEGRAINVELQGLCTSRFLFHKRTMGAELVSNSLIPYCQRIFFGGNHLLSIR